MADNFFDAIQPCLMERLGGIYNSDNGYKECVGMETKAFARLEESITGSQMEMVKDYRNAIYATFGVCEVLAYRQGMRDFAEIVGTGVKVNGADKLIKQYGGKDCQA